MEGFTIDDEGARIDPRYRDRLGPVNTVNKPQIAHKTSVVKGIPLGEEPGLGALTLPGFLREVTTRFADREALVLHTPAGAIRWTYAMLWEQAVDVARALISCGVEDSRVGVLMTNRPEWISAFFGIGLAGGVAVALSTFSTLLELEYLLQASSVGILLLERHVARKDFVEMLRELEPEIRSEKPGRVASLKFPSSATTCGGWRMSGRRCA